MKGFTEWMINSNIRTIDLGADPKKVIATLRSNGYHLVAKGVENRLNK